MEPSPLRVANRFVLKEAAAQVVAGPLTRQARRNKGASKVRRELTADVLAAFGEAAVDAPGLRVAGAVDRMKTLYQAFQTAPRKWEEFKKMLGLKSESFMQLARELPGKIKRMFGDAQKWLSGAGEHLKQKIPLLRLYLDVGVKMPGVGDWIKNLLPHMPEPVQKAVAAISAKARSFAEWLDELFKKHRVLKPAAALLSAAIFGFVWWNVMELSWDIPEIIRGFLGGYSFVELLHSLPESGVGFLLKLMFPGIPGGMLWNILLPLTILMRLAWLMHKDYIEWSPGKSLVVHWGRLGIQPPPDRVPATINL